MRMATPTRCTQGVRQKSPESSSKKHQENSNPNLNLPSPVPRPSSSPSIIVKSGGKSQKSVVKNPNPNPTFVSPKKKIRERKFVVAKKRNPKNQALNLNCKCKNKIKGKCLCVAYESLRASQEEFFKSRSSGVEECENGGVGVEGNVERGKENKPIIENTENPIGYEKDVKKSELPGSDEMGHCEPQQPESPKGLGSSTIKSMTENIENPIGYEKDVKKTDLSGSDEMGHCEPQQAESPKGLGSSTIKRSRDLLLEEARKSVPEPGSGRVKHLVKAFERLLTIPKESDKKEEREEEETKKGIKWALPGLQQPSRASETQQSSSVFCPGELFFNAESLGLDSQVSSSFDSRRGSVSSRSSFGSRRRSGSFSSGIAGPRKWKKKQRQNRATSLRPFKLRTEERGKAKEEEFLKKLQEMMIEEEKQRIPIAQGLPWTTDEPECLIKPPIKECTKPIDLKLHSDVRAEERAEFDHQVNEKMMLIEQYRLERERQLKLEEEEEIRRLRKELVPKAQPMPYFDRPFVPRRSEKQPTIPKEPKFHVPQHKKIKCCQSWNDFDIECIHAT